MAKSPPKVEWEYYELMVQFQGDRSGMCDFALEIATEFGCKVAVNQVDQDGNVVEGLVPWEKELRDR